MTGKAEVISGNEQARTHDSSQFFLAAASTCASTLSNAFLSSKRPFRNTAFMRCALLIFSSELASSNRRLAIFPFSTVPRVFCKFRNIAGFKLADCKPQGNQSIEAADGTNLFFRDWGTGRRWSLWHRGDSIQLGGSTRWRTWLVADCAVSATTAAATPGFFGTPKNRVSQEIMDWWVRMMVDGCSLKTMLDLQRMFTETDFRPELRRISVPTLLIHGDNETSTPIETTARKTVQLIPGSQLKVYEGAAHGLTITHAGQLNADLLAFAKG